MPSTLNLSNQTTVRFSAEERWALERAAADRHCTIGAVIRWAVRETLVKPAAGERWSEYSRPAETPDRQ